MGKITLYHGTPDKLVSPRYGGGEDKHDYGRGFYLTEDIEHDLVDSDANQVTKVFSTLFER